MNNKQYFENYLKTMNDSNVSMEEKFKLSSEYNKRYFDELDTTNVVYKFMRDFLRIEPSIGKSNDQQFEAEEFIKALGIINSTTSGNLKYLYFMKVLMEVSKDMLPVYPEQFMVKVSQLEKSMDLIIKYGIDNNIIKIDDKDLKVMNSSDSVTIKHSDAAMKEDDVTVSENGESKVEKESANNKKEEDKKEKKEKRKEKKAIRKKTEKWFNYNSISKVSEELKSNKPNWYKVANRIATLFNQEEVQKIVGDQKCNLLIYQNTTDFAVITENNQTVFWFGEKEVTPFYDMKLFNTKWAEAHAKEIKFTA